MIKTVKLILILIRTHIYPNLHNRRIISLPWRVAGFRIGSEGMVRQVELIERVARTNEVEVS